ncbi:MAG: HEAT repeat domain-containing protein [Planctomycetes bacterium]|nr:HEAT repeat domain-containing protein [Planctomycetota bacterium]
MTLDIRNTPRSIRKSFGSLRLLFAENDKKTYSKNISYCPVFTDPYDEATVLAPGKEISLGFEMVEMAEISSPKLTQPLTPGRYVVGMGYIDLRLKPVFMTNSVEVEILPIGVTDIDNFAKYLKPYKSDSMKIKAGFVPYKTEVVLGEPLLTSFTVKNLTEKPITFGFGGDYRGTGRHDRFGIKAFDSEGNLLADPKALPDGTVMRMGGLGMSRTSHPNNLWIEIINILDFRKIESPGVYTINCSFTLTTDVWGGGFGTDKKDSDVTVETSYELTVLPRSDRNVQRVIDQLRQKAERSSHQLLTNAINAMCSFGGEAAVPTLVKLSTNDQLDLCIAAIKGLGQLPTYESLAALIAAEAGGDKSTRLTALESMAAFTTDEAMAIVVGVVVAALADPDEDIRGRAAKTLGSMKGKTVIDALIERLPESQPKVASAILRAMGRTKSPDVFEFLVESLDNENSDCRYAGVDGLVAFGGEDAVKVLKTCIEEDKGGALDDMDLREYIVTKLINPMKQPIDAQWFVPIIKSRKNSNSLGHPPRLMRLYTGEKAVPALLSCLDFENPSTRSYYQHSIIYSQGSCDGGLITPWVCDRNRDGTPEEIESNRRTLKRLKKWVEHYYENRMDEKPGEKYPNWWGNPVDGISIRVRVNQRVWPEGMNQLIMFDVRNHPGEGTMNIFKVPDALEVEINGEWYVRQLALKEGTSGIEGRGKSVKNIVLDEKWIRISDGKQLELKPGKYTLRVGLSIKPEDQRTGMVESKPIKFEVIETD